MKVYKVVTLYGKKRVCLTFSSPTNTQLDNYMVVYTPHRWITPYVGRVLCFGDLESARKFTREVVVNCEIWECKAKRVSKIKKILNWGCWYYQPEAIQLFWEAFGKRKYIDSLPYMPAPEGTIAAKSIKLEKKIF